MDKTREREGRAETSTARLRKEREALSLANVELHLEAASDRADADPLEPVLDRADVRHAVEQLSDRLVPEGSDEWSDVATDARLLVGADRLLVRFELGTADSREYLAQRLDRVFDLVFDLASALRLEVFDPQLQTAVSRFRYEQQFQRFLDAYHTRARTAAALISPEGWEDLGESELVPPSELPAIETEPEALPPAAWGRSRRALGVLEFSGERALRALSGVDRERPFVAIVPPNAAPGDDAAVLRVRRLTRPVPGLALVDVGAEGVARIHSVEGTSSLLLRIADR